ASKNHKGTDFYGFPTVHAIADGEVVFAGWYSSIAGWLPVSGYMVWLQCDGFFVRYLHNDADTARVSAGDRVDAGDPLIDMGWSGLASAWDEHVHVEITPGQWHRGNVGQVDPVQFIEARIGQSTAGGGSADHIIERLTTMAEAYVKAPNGTIAHLRSGGKTNFKDPTQYAEHQATIKKLIGAGATDLIKPPTINKVPAVTWAQFE